MLKKLKIKKGVDMLKNLNLQEFKRDLPNTLLLFPHSKHSHEKMNPRLITDQHLGGPKHIVSAFFGQQCCASH